MAKKSSPLPGWISDLRPLADSVGFLTDLASNPVRTLRTVVLTIVSTFIVGGVLDIGRSVVDAVLAVGEAIVAIPAAAGNLLGGAGTAVAVPIFEAVGWFRAEVDAAAASLGPWGVFLQVGVYALLFAIAMRALPALLVAASDLLGAVPVVGSVLDALVTFVVEFGTGGD